MRDIKFRALREDNNEMIYGCCGYGFTQKIEYIAPKIYFATRDFGELDTNGNSIIEDEIAIGGYCWEYDDEDNLVIKQNIKTKKSVGNN